MLKKSLVLVIVATVSAFFAYKINLPLPFFLGPVFGVMILAFNGFEFKFPTYFWDLTRIVVGTYLGTKLNEQIISNLILWSGSFVLQIILIILSVIAAFIAKILKIPAPFFLGPVLSTGLIYAGGFSTYQFPDLGLNICLVIIGAYIGLRFQNYRIGDFIKNLKYTFFSILILFFITLSFCYFSHVLFGHDFIALFLSYTPGGIYE